MGDTKEGIRWKVTEAVEDSTVMHNVEINSILIVFFKCTSVYLLTHRQQIDSGTDSQSHVNLYIIKSSNISIININPDIQKRPENWIQIFCCCINSWTLETEQHHTGQPFPDLTARSFEADTITLKCKGDMTVSSEPDGSILSWLIRIWAVVLQPWFFFFFMLPFWK